MQYCIWYFANIVLTYYSCDVFTGCSGLAFVASKNLSQKVALLCWPQDCGKNEAAMVEILDDVWNLYIDSQGGRS